jgi:hypothetical protein
MPTLAAVNMYPSVKRGDVLQCTRCPENAEALVMRKDTLPEGWIILQWRAKSGEIAQRILCPVCDQHEVARWRPNL